MTPLGRISTRPAEPAPVGAPAGPVAQEDESCCFVGRRRRGPELERAIFDATIGELAKHGLEAMTMEGVATAARTGKASLYRRWATKEELVLDAVGCSMPAADGVGGSTGSLREDLLRALRGMTEFLSSAQGRITRSLLATADPDHPLLELTRSRLIEPRHQRLRSFIAEGIERGEARPGTATLAMAQVGPALVLQRFMLWGRVDHSEVLSIVDDVLMPLLRA